MTYDPLLDPAPATEPSRTTLTYTELLGIADNLIAFSEHRTPGLGGLTFDALAAFVEAAPQRPNDIDQRAIPIARRHIEDAANGGHPAALKARARLNGGAYEEPSRTSFDDSDLRPTVDNITTYLDARGTPGIMAHLSVKFSEYAEIVWSGERRSVEPRVIAFARETLTEKAQKGNATAANLLREMKPTNR